MPERPPAWLLITPKAVPQQWRERALEMSLVPLLPTEAEYLSANLCPVPADPDEERLMRAIARGLTAAAIARELHLSPSTVERRMTRLRNRFDVASNPELVAFLARRGF